MKARGRGLNHVNLKWFKLKDSNGDLVGDYLQKVGEFSVYFFFFESIINVCKFSGSYFIYLEYLVVNILIFKVK